MNEEFESLRDLWEKIVHGPKPIDNLNQIDEIGQKYNEDHPNEKVTAFQNKLVEIAEKHVRFGWDSYGCGVQPNNVVLPLPPDEKEMEYTRQGQVFGIMKEAVFFD